MAAAAHGHRKSAQRIEHVHRLTRAVSVGSTQEFLQADKEDQEVTEACKQLIKNSIICWNYLYLTQKLAEIKDPVKRDDLCTRGIRLRRL